MDDAKSPHKIAKTLSSFANTAHLTVTPQCHVIVQSLISMSPSHHTVVNLSNVPSVSESEKYKVEGNKNKNKKKEEKIYREEERERVQAFACFCLDKRKKTLRVNSDELPHRTVPSSDSVPYSPSVNPLIFPTESAFAASVIHFVSFHSVSRFRSRIDYDEFESKSLCLIDSVQFGSLNWGFRVEMFCNYLGGKKKKKKKKKKKEEEEEDEEEEEVSSAVVILLMSRKLDSPVQTQMAVAVISSSPLGREYHGKQPAGRRRVFVQTEKGCVLGMELDRGDNAHTVKRRLQLALNVPIEESSLTFGDIVLKNDLSAVRNDSPLLLTRNLMHRSSSTPCLSPTGRDIQQRDRSGPIEILGQSNRLDRIKLMIKDIMKAIKMGIDPIPVNSGLGGAYYFRNSKGDSVAIVKPTDEEPFAPNNPKGFVGKALGQPGLKRSVRVGETGFREVAAYLLDYDHFANVPPTALVKITHSVFNVNDGVNGNCVWRKRLVSKIASFQQFIPHDFDASDHGTSSFPVDSVHRIGILDVRILNTDRHAGNLLVRKLDGMGGFGRVELIPIDHGLCLPETLEDPYFEWIHWPQASIPFSEEELAYIDGLDPYHDCEMLRMELPMIREACLRVLVLCTIFLKEAAGYGLCLAEIGEMMTREFRRGEEEPSELEVVCLEARKLVAVEREVVSPRTELRDDEFQFDLDCDEVGSDFTPKMAMDVPLTRAPFHPALGNGHVHSLLSKLDECIEEEEEEEEESEGEYPQAFVPSLAQDNIQTVSELSVSLKNTMLDGKNQNYSGGKVDNGHSANSSSGHKSANEQLPASISFVKVADMSEDEWTLFLEKFQELLYPAFAKRKSITLGQRQRQRLGTSCQF
ncbi:hypothetical protein VNO77_39715 [Canavalia gladiata]|uniref:1-phosphatidylinositol 4-kinase n=1 Tax=Canavalia gladiata TaxID=3824 RepID=A0AAN9PRJ6_CANGL